jgi:hypothetical protein
MRDLARPVQRRASGLAAAVTLNVESLARNASSPDRATAWSALGVWVGASPPASPITYAAWLAGGTGYWGWITV